MFPSTFCNVYHIASIAGYISTKDIPQVCLIKGEPRKYVADYVNVFKILYWITQRELNCIRYCQVKIFYYLISKSWWDISINQLAMCIYVYIYI